MSEYPKKIEELSRRIKILQSSIRFCKNVGGSTEAAFKVELSLRKSELKRMMQKHLKNMED